MRYQDFYSLMEQEIDFRSEIIKLYKLFAIEKVDRYSTLKEKVEKHFRKWEYRDTYISLDEFLNQKGLNYNIENLSDPQHIYTIDNFILYSEMLTNFLHLIRSYTDHKNTTIIIRNIRTILQKINYKVIRVEKDKFIIIENSDKAAAVANLLDKDSAKKTIAYNHLLKGNLDKKKDILLGLANNYEPLKDNLKLSGFSNLVTNTDFLLNNFNIRHNNSKGKNYKKYVANLSSKQLEEWYDKTYSSLQLCILAHDYIELNNEIQTIRKEYFKKANKV